MRHTSTSGRHRALRRPTLFHRTAERPVQDTDKRRHTLLSGHVSVPVSIISQRGRHGMDRRERWQCAQPPPRHTEPGWHDEQQWRSVHRRDVRPPRTRMDTQQPTCPGIQPGKPSLPYHPYHRQPHQCFPFLSFGRDAGRQHRHRRHRRYLHSPFFTRT